MDRCDPEVIESLRFHLRDQAVTFRFGEEVSKVEIAPKGTITSLASGKRIAADMVMYSAGRQGVTDELELEKAGLAADHARYRELTRGAIVGDSYGMLKLLVSTEDRHPARRTRIRHERSIPALVQRIRNHLRQPGGSPAVSRVVRMADPEGVPGTAGAPIGSVAIPESGLPERAPERSGLLFVYLGDHCAWRTGYSQATQAWSTQHPPGIRSVLNRDQAPRG